jgi:hypothetical protein
MRRIQFFEFGDLDWYPGFLRSGLTDFLHYMICRFGVYKSATPIIQRGLEKTNSNQIVDLCSGSSGPWTELLSENVDVFVTLTDKFPNPAAIDRSIGNNSLNLRYASEPVDAQSVPRSLTGMRTIFTGFHHFNPIGAKKILQDAADCDVAICVFEFTDRSFPNWILSSFFTFFLVLFRTPFIAPMTLSKIIFTYCIPILPLLITFDALISNLRTYSVRELRELVDGVEDRNYVWEIGKLPSPLPKSHITYLLGYPEY